MSDVSKNMRIYHRYLGFFLAGIMAIYSISGIIMIFRETDFLKKENHKVLTVATNLKNEEIGPAIKIKNLKVKSDTLDVVTFEQGTYNKTTGVADFKVKELPTFINKITKLHKATHKDPLYYLNIFFGVSLLFFVISSFWMFMPGTTIFKKGMYFTLAGIVLALVMLFI
ncbi:MAG: hypothetical protein ACKOWO_08610 [Sediminibacterium sp.]